MFYNTEKWNKYSGGNTMVEAGCDAVYKKCSNQEKNNCYPYQA